MSMSILSALDYAEKTRFPEDIEYVRKLAEQMTRSGQLSTLSRDAVLARLKTLEEKNDD